MRKSMSFGFKGYLTKIQFDGKRFTKKMEEKGMQVMRAATREWLLAAYPGVPVWSGMARGAFKYARGRSGASSGIFLGEYLKIAVDIPNTRTYDSGPREERGGIHPKNPQEGGAQSRYTFSFSNGTFRFTFNTAVRHFYINDELSGKPPSYSRPWKSLQTGRNAFDNYLRAHAKEVIPKVTDFMVLTKIGHGNG